MVEGKVSLYVCGITAYDYSHMGHGRAYVSFVTTPDAIVTTPTDTIRPPQPAIFEQEVAATVESMEKAARYTSNKYVEAALNSATVVLPYLVPFMNDALIMGEWSLLNAKNLSRILTCFHLSSGLKVNFYKSKLFGIGVTNSEVNSLASTIDCLPSHFPCIYVGLPIGGNMARCANWSILVDKFQKRLSKWKSKSLSFGGRLTHKKTKSQAKSNKTSHGMEKCVKAKPKSKSQIKTEKKGKAKKI
ncbi:putative RNA-directed DNA polymerase, eukaryota, reverse transcriptase zinc-binding domain protein [Tanacetum coccineum]|uniref:RNA-directed DNA polymerase, eukaryota, reverse transcriptase zinc-binding domain protein n=1 Tax=Tanacetum coccineum TaxID=301880 RepID=A0ABQ4YDU4_9ASTR